MAGKEVVQLYITNQDKSIKAQLKFLKGFSRINLNPGESKIVEFTLSPKDLSYINSARKSVPFNRKVEISTGGSQADETIKTSGNVTKKSILIL